MKTRYEKSLCNTTALISILLHVKKVILYSKMYLVGSLVHWHLFKSGFSIHALMSIQLKQ